MSQTFYLDDAAGAVTVDDGSGIVLGTTAMAFVPGGSAGLDFLIPNAVSRKRFFVEDEGEVTRVSSGTLTVHCNLAVAGDVGGTATCQAFRVNGSTGAIITSGVETGTSGFGSAGTVTFTPDITGLGTWGATDRLAIAIKVNNTGAHGGDDTYTITVGVADATNDVVASGFTGPPALTGGSFGDSTPGAGRDWTTPFQDFQVNFDSAVGKAGGLNYTQGDTIPGLTIGGNAVTYRSDEDTAALIVRVAALFHNGDSVTAAYDRTTGELTNAGGSEVSTATGVALTNSLTKRIRATLKRGDTEAAITTACDLAVLDAEPRDSDDGAWLTVLQRHPNVTPSGAGLIDVQATDASLVVGDIVYLAVFNPREDATTASVYARTALVAATVT